MINSIELTQKEFELFQQLIFNEIGVTLENSKKFLLKSRLLKKLLQYNLNSYGDYYRFIQVNSEEKVEMLNLITTNETYFFREFKHFEFLESLSSDKTFEKSLRVWSAASSVGAEAYSIAMLLDDLNIDYKIIATDVNTEVIKKANIGVYPLKWMDKIPDKYKKKYCLKGKGESKGLFLVDRVLVKNIKFEQYNLINFNHKLGFFDIIFLRNVLIYFNKESKKHIIENVLKNLSLGGYLIISMTEHIHDFESYGLKKVNSSIFQKV